MQDLHQYFTPRIFNPLAILVYRYVPLLVLLKKVPPVCLSILEVVDSISCV
jgi:hypothetical protein